MRVLIMGCGRVGASLARSLAEEQHEVVVIDVNIGVFRRLPNHPGIQPVAADGTLQEDLRRAGIQKADVFIGVAAGDARNAMAAQMARHVFNVPKVICRFKDPVREKMYSSMGYETISPTSIVSKLILEAVQK